VEVLIVTTLGNAVAAILAMLPSGRKVAPGWGAGRGELTVGVVDRLTR
jgi:hypothetical protein